jgi:hypothetical protein
MEIGAAMCTWVPHLPQHNVTMDCTDNDFCRAGDGRRSTVAAENRDPVCSEALFRRHDPHPIFMAEGYSWGGYVFPAIPVPVVRALAQAVTAARS